jgi:translation initiation factor IF-1
MKPNHSSVTGTVQNVFAHRFTLRTADGVVLADLTPHGEAKIKLLVGDEVTIEGERKPSEIKVERIRRGDFAATIEPHKKHEPSEASDLEGDPETAVASARAAGFDIVGDPRRKPKHFEILGRRNGDLAEVHVSLDGTIRHAKPVQANDGKWQAELANEHR